MNAQLQRAQAAHDDRLPDEDSGWLSTRIGAEWMDDSIRSLLRLEPVFVRHAGRVLEAGVDNFLERFHAARREIEGDDEEHLVDQALIRGFLTARQMKEYHELARRIAQEMLEPMAPLAEKSHEWLKEDVA